MVVFLANGRVWIEKKASGRGNSLDGAEVIVDRLFVAGAPVVLEAEHEDVGPHAADAADFEQRGHALRQAHVVQQTVEHLGLARAQPVVGLLHQLRALAVVLALLKKRKRKEQQPPDHQTSSMKDPSES